MSPAGTAPGLGAHTARVLLPVGDSHGTLAAVRSLGRAGAHVTVADWRQWVAARWSRYATRTVRCPPVGREPEGFMRWLLKEGMRNPGQVLLPTTDELAWLFAKNRDVLGLYFHLDVPPVEAVYGVLNKQRLAGHCAAVGLRSPATWRYESEAQLARLAPELPDALVVKPQTQVLLEPHQKGRLVERRDQLLPAVRDLLASTHHHRHLLAFDPDAWRPMLQQAVARGRGVYSLTGFVDASGALLAARACRKVFQRPRVLGIGLCFESAEVVPELAERVRALAVHAGYHGVFEAELLETDGAAQLIDFNPRFFGELAFDVARGLDLPRLAYLAALGDAAALRAEAARAAVPPPGAPAAWCDRIHLELFLASLRLAGAPEDDAGRWHHWLDEHRGGLADAVLDADDWRPAAVAALTAAALQALHPRSTYRQARER